jgi:hypothetical protein
MAILKIPVTKAGNRQIEIDTASIPDEMYNLAVEEGLKILLNKGMSKVPAAKGLEGKDLDDVRNSAYLIAEANLVKLKEGKMRKGRAAAVSKDGTKVSGVVMTEARRLAKEVVKNEIRAAGMKISHVEASEITKAANEIIASDPSYIETAQANIEARTAKVVSVNIKSLVHESPKLVAAAAKRKAESAAQLSSKQAGKVAPRKPKAEAHVGH